MTSSTRTPDVPAFRKLRGYAFDPSLSATLSTSGINNLVYRVAWEPLEPGPVGEYVEVLDYDPSTRSFYEPVDLNSMFALAQDGFDPSESDPRFHQQMVYAVAMTTISNFEQALGRKILWAPRQLDPQKSGGKFEEYTARLRIYPHALREANAYYSPQKKALLFGYFSATPADETLLMPNSLVFSCLSHDIVAHEITHAILDGMHRNYTEPTNPDVLAFHEAFADIVALFQHFTFPEVLKNQIAKTRGNLSSQNLLGQLAQQFGTAIGSYGSLRDALGSVNETTKTWEPLIPNPDAYRTQMEPHVRGSILVAAVFEAFVTIYKSRIADLLRIASGGSGVLPAGELHPDLVNRLAGEASKAARHVLTMCIRAIDYCPPVDINFGDYLRALITADVELIADDDHDYRLAFIDAFRRRGIYPEGLNTLSVESLRYPLLNIEFKKKENNEKELVGKDSDGEKLAVLANSLRDYADAITYQSNRADLYKITDTFIRDSGKGNARKDGLHSRLGKHFTGSVGFSRLTGLTFVRDYARLGVRKSPKYQYDGPAFRIRNLRLVNRVGPNGEKVNQVLFSVVQVSYLDSETLNPVPPETENCLAFKGGSTLIFDLDTLSLRYAVNKPLIDVAALNEGQPAVLNSRRLEAFRRFLTEQGNSGLETALRSLGADEPFAFLHQH